MALPEAGWIENDYENENENDRFGSTGCVAGSSVAAAVKWRPYVFLRCSSVTASSRKNDTTSSTAANAWAWGYSSFCTSS